MQFLGIDTGGTFTDFVLFDGVRLRVHKVLSTPHAPELAILQGIGELSLQLDHETVVVHGSTVATNALLEGKGVPTVYITNSGLADVLSIGRQARRELYNLQPVPQPPPVPREYCLEVAVRISASGERLEALTQQGLERLQQQVDALRPQAIAINLLYSFLDDSDERRIAAALVGKGFISCSADVLPLYGEYERGIATWLNSYVGPLMQGYLSRLQQGLAPATLTVMQSSGGTIAAGLAARRAVNLLLSGPAGGLAAARAIASATGIQQLLTFDMGGTSTDVAIINGDIRLTNEACIAGYPVAVPMVDMHTIGAGGGSIAYIDEGGLLCVGPQSAGASPGPACYGRGGTQATVTDANLLLGRLRADAFLGGGMTLDLQAAHLAVERLATQLDMDILATAEGIIAIANEHMARALRVMSIQRGEDPREYTLMSFGGAGGLHVCALAEALQMTRALVPANAGVLSALGMLCAPASRQLTHTLVKPLAQLSDTQLQQQFAGLMQTGIESLQQEGIDPAQIESVCSLDLRYPGQSYTLNIAWQSVDDCIQQFHQRHHERYGHAMELPVELVNLRAGLYAPAILPSLPLAADASTDTGVQRVILPGVEAEVAIHQRTSLHAGDEISGPALITETVATTWVAAGWSCRPDTYGNLLLIKRI